MENTHQILNNLYDKNNIKYFNSFKNIDYMLKCYCVGYIWPNKIYY